MLTVESKLCLNRARSRRASLTSGEHRSPSSTPENGDRFRPARPASGDILRPIEQRSPRSEIAPSIPALYATGLTAVGPEAIFAAPWEYTNDGSFLVFPEAANLREWTTLLDVVQCKQDESPL